MLTELERYEPFGKKCMEAKAHFTQDTQNESIMDFSKITFSSSQVTSAAPPPTFHKLFSISDTSTINMGTGFNERKINHTGKLENLALDLEQEIYVQGSTVVWSRAGYILKTFDYSKEKQLIQQVLFAWFPFHSASDPTSKPAADINAHDMEGEDRIVDDYWQKKGPQSIINYNSVGAIIQDTIPFVEGNKVQRRTLCIVFQNNIRIHCEDGMSFTSQIPFEIGDVVPLDVGLLVSRKHEPKIKSRNRKPLQTGAASFFVTVTHPLRGACPVKTKEVSHTGINTLPEQFTSPQKLLFATTKSSETGRLPVVVTLNIKENKHYIWTYDRRKEKNQLPKTSQTPTTKKRKASQAYVSKKLPGTLNRKKSKLNAADSPRAQFHEDYISDDEMLHENEAERDLWHELLDNSEITLRLLWRESHGTKMPAKLKGVKDVKSQSFLIHDLNGQELICILNNTLGSLQVINLSKATQLLNDCIEFKTPAKLAIPINATRDSYHDLLFVDANGSLEIYVDKGARLSLTQPKQGNLVNLIDPVYDRFTAIYENGQMFRYRLQLRPKTSLVRDCLAAISCATSFYFPKIWCRYLKLAHITPLVNDSDRIHADEWQVFFVTLLSFLSLKKQGYYTGTKKPASSQAAVRDIKLQQIKASNIEYMTQKLGFMAITPELNYDYLLDENYYQGVPAPWIDRVITFRPKDYMEEELYLDSFEFTEIVKSLHIIYEDYRINKSMKMQANLLGYLLLQSTVILKNKDWIEYYKSQGLNPLFTVNLTLVGDEPREILIEPPNIQICLRQMTPNTSSNPTLLSSFGVNTLEPATGHCHHNYARTVKNLWSLYGAINTGEKTILLDRMVAERITRNDIEILIDTVSFPILEALDYLKENPMINWSKESYTVIGRNDMYKQLKLKPTVCDPNTEIFKLPFQKESDHSQSVNDLIEGCSAAPVITCPYKTDILNMETERLRFGFGGVIEKVRVMLDGSRIPDIEVEVLPDTSDDDITREHQAHVILAVKRTLSVGVGRAIFAYGTYVPDLTRVPPIEPLVLSGKILPLRKIVNLDEQFYGPDFLHWPEFHNGVAAGLRISPSNNINDSWIAFCYPTELGPEHGGLLLALGLNGTLKKLSVVDWYQFISQPCDLVSVGFLLGTAAAFRGTMDVKAAKLISVHVPELLPAGSNSFAQPISVQAASILGIGLLYMNSSSRVMTMTMFNEIGKNASTSNPILKPGAEVFALSAGFSLGLITLGAGDDILRLDPQMCNKLNHLITGRSVIFTEDGLEEKVDQNIATDVTSAGATIALALMYLKTENVRVAQSIDMLKTRPYLNYVQPHYLLLRVVAKSLIMWSTILPTVDWIESQVPEFIVEDMNNPDLPPTDLEVTKQAMYNIIGGACLSVGLRYAGSKNEDALECLTVYLDKFGRMLGIPEYNPQQKITRVAIRTCLGVVCTAAAMVMAGTGNLELLTRLELLNDRLAPDMDYGNHMAVGMSLGMLFVGLGGYTLTTSNEAIAGLLCAFYPFYPMNSEDNQDHLQAFRHLWVLAVDSRWLMPFDVDSKKPCRVPMRLEIYEDNGKSLLQRKVRHMRIEAPSVVPDYKLIKSIHLDGDRYWPLFINMGSGEYQESIIKSGLMYVKKKKGKKSYEEDPFGKRSLTW
ncbi:hypothetical protein INT47_005187 [Mucor saturninus]|uniref:Anaphase-promoting complex subunit 1 n=1 Tax=Mucor saturninus TaxID=64648 RepID=A0A8H7QWJ9_9FUNG|nr:hypothetical protein INT47_005187 [Mucor saturninus]